MDTTRRKVMLVGAAVLLVMGGVLVAFYSGSREPSYQGKTLSEWVTSEDFTYPIPQPEKAAIRAMGTNIIPYLLEWMQYEQPAWKDQLNDYFAKFTGQEFFSHQLIFAVWRARKAPIAFSALGAKAKLAIPELTKLMNANSNYLEIPHRAAFALAGIGEAALPPLMVMTSNQQAKVRGTAITVIGLMGTNAILALPNLVQCLADTNENIVIDAIQALGRMKSQPAIVVPALTNFLADSRLKLRFQAMLVLEQFGPAAHSAVPHFKSLFSDSTPMVRIRATNALLKIAPETLTNVPVR